MAKKQKKATPERTPTKHQLSKWQRQMRIRRIVIVAAVVFLVGISSWVGYGYHKDYEAKNTALREIVLWVNRANFTMEYFVKALDAFTGEVNSTFLRAYGNYFAGMVASKIIEAEVMRQGAESLNISVSDAELDAKVKLLGYDPALRDIVRAMLLGQKLSEQYFGPGVNATMPQARIQVMLVESQNVGNDVIARVRAGGNFTALVRNFSCNPSTEGDLGWLPAELMPNMLVAEAAFNLTPGNISQPIYDETAIKSIGYWLMNVTAKQDDKIDALVMLLGSKAEADQIRAQLLAGGNFSALAGNYSQHESKAKGGQLVGLRRGAMNSTAFDRVAFNLTLNTVSQPERDTSVTTMGGYWMVMVVERGEREVGDEMKQQLIERRSNEWFDMWRQLSLIENLLNSTKISWAVNKVLEKR